MARSADFDMTQQATVDRIRIEISNVRYYVAYASVLLDSYFELVLKCGSYSKEAVGNRQDQISKLMMSLENLLQGVECKLPR